jgi:hypothetical protein
MEMLCRKLSSVWDGHIGYIIFTNFRKLTSFLSSVLSEDTVLGLVLERGNNDSWSNCHKTFENKTNWSRLTEHNWQTVQLTFYHLSTKEFL